MDIPSLTTYVQDYFNCHNDSILPGYIIARSDSFHPDQRTFQNDLFQPVIEAFSGMSPLTTELLKTTGFYNVNHFYDDGYTYGKGKGCDFILKDGAYLTQNFAEFNNSVPEKSRLCHYSRRGGAVQSQSSGEYEVNLLYRNRDPADSCENSFYPKGSPIDVQTRGLSPSNGSRNKSHCFDGNLRSDTIWSSAGHWTYCFKTRCAQSGSSWTLTVQANNGTTIRTCSNASPSTFTVPPYPGVVNCPPNVDDFCNTTSHCPKGCLNQGTCYTSGRCECNSGWLGLACNLRAQYQG